MTQHAAGIVTYRGAVYASHCDHIGHMNIASYGAKFDEANWVFFCEIGLTPSYLRGERYGMAGVQQNISYKQELFAGDVIEIRIARAGGRREAPARPPRDAQHRDRRGGCVCEITAVHLDKQAHKSCPLPPAVRQAAAGAAGGRALDARSRCAWPSSPSPSSSRRSSPASSAWPAA